MTLKIERDSKLKASTNMVIVQLGLYVLPIIAMRFPAATFRLTGFKMPSKDML